MTAKSHFAAHGQMAQGVEVLKGNGGSTAQLVSHPRRGTELPLGFLHNL